MSKIDWDGIRRLQKAAEGDPIVQKMLGGIKFDAYSLFGLDENHNLYWDGKMIEVKNPLNLSKAGEDRCCYCSLCCVLVPICQF